MPCWLTIFLRAVRAPNGLVQCRSCAARLVKAPRRAAYASRGAAAAPRTGRRGESTTGILATVGGAGPARAALLGEGAGRAPLAASTGLFRFVGIGPYCWKLAAGRCPVNGPQGRRAPIVSVRLLSRRPGARWGSVAASLAARPFFTRLTTFGGRALAAYRRSAASPAVPSWHWTSSLASAWSPFGGRCTRSS